MGPINTEKKVKLSRPDYYQGILQLRDINKDVLDFVNHQLDKRNDVMVTRTVKLANGYDLYITSQQFIRAVSKKLKESFGGELKTSAKLHTRSRQGKDLYRVNAMFKLAKYKAGDIVEVRGDKVKIIRIGNKIFVKDIKTGRKHLIRREELPEN